jgi:hypothetical protein
MNAIADGHATDRDKVFFRQQHRFTTGVASIAEVAAALDMNVLTERKVSVDKTSEAHAIIFHLFLSWNAAEQRVRGFATIIRLSRHNRAVAAATIC